ncbi:protein CANDIDATE G-PROTEIN COUPLED RECEPTOR 7-like [Silene latifolia]|uniref:protein CANDIDATE G-PROTEIN COUPLED RECEPTOR 7-like n=1 Tax=Silene latifolia TaxID=37657 RepID=UPI003D76E1D3
MVPFPYLAIIFSLLLLPPYTLSETRLTTLRSDSRPIIPLDEFGFTHSGNLELNGTLLSLHLHNPTNPNPNSNPDSNDLSLVGFFLCTAESWARVLDQIAVNDIVCPLQSDVVLPVFSFDRLNNGGLTEFNLSVPIHNPNLFSLVFANCIPNLRISMDVYSSMYNFNSKTLIRDYLSAGKSNLPAIYFSIALIYVTLSLIWGFLIYAKRVVVYKIHFFMLAVLILKTLNLFCEAEDKSYIKRTGTAHGWDVLFYIFSFLKGITLFTLIVLIGTGWSFLKPYLQDKEKRVLMIVIPLQVVSNVAQVVVDETGPYGEDSDIWMEVFLVIDLICCCAVLFPIVWSINNLEDASRTDGKVKVNLLKLKLFRHYYVVVIFYIYFTRVIVYGLETITSYRYQWTSVVAGELGTLVFYVFTGYNFRPKLHNPYFVVDDEEEEAAVEMLSVDED